jgi:hypothetical protein
MVVETRAVMLEWWLRQGAMVVETRPVKFEKGSVEVEAGGHGG